MFEECPYKASNNGRCYHVGKKKNRKGKRFCSYSNPLKCELYTEWLKKRKATKLKVKNGYKPL